MDLAMDQVVVKKGERKEAKKAAKTAVKKVVKKAARKDLINEDQRSQRRLDHQVISERRVLSKNRIAFIFL